MPIDQLTISGPTLAALLQSLYSQHRPCDGLLLGTVSTRRSTQAHDTSDALVIEETLAHISSTCTCIGTHSFYTNTGQIREDALQQLLRSATSSQHHQQQQQQRQQLLGWFSYRPATPPVPSMREVAVSRNLQSWVSSSSSSSSSSDLGARIADTSLAAAGSISSSSELPVLFALINSQQDHSNATISLQYTFYNIGHPSSSSGGSSSRATAGGSRSSSSKSKVPDRHPYLQPVDLMVHNLGASHTAAGGAAVDGSSSSSSTHTWGSSGLPALGAALDCSSSSSSILSLQQRQHLGAAATSADAAVGAVQSMYDSLLDELQVAAAQVAAQQSRLDDLQAENAALRQQVLEAAAAAAEPKKGLHIHSKEGRQVQE